jgi:hypothetical protein
LIFSFPGEVSGTPLAPTLCRAPTWFTTGIKENLQDDQIRLSYHRTDHPPFQFESCSYIFPTVFDFHPTIERSALSTAVTQALEKARLALHESAKDRGPGQIAAVLWRDLRASIQGQSSKDVDLIVTDLCQSLVSTRFFEAPGYAEFIKHLLGTSTNLPARSTAVTDRLHGAALTALNDGRFSEAAALFRIALQHCESAESAANYASSVLTQIFQSGRTDRDAAVESLCDEVVASRRRSLIHPFYVALRREEVRSEAGDYVDSLIVDRVDPIKIGRVCANLGGVGAFYSRDRSSLIRTAILAVLREMKELESPVEIVDSLRKIVGYAHLLRWVTGPEDPAGGPALFRELTDPIVEALAGVYERWWGVVLAFPDPIAVSEETARLAKATKSLVDLCEGVNGFDLRIIHLVRGAPPHITLGGDTLELFALVANQSAAGNVIARRITHEETQAASLGQSPSSGDLLLDDSPDNEKNLESRIRSLAHFTLLRFPDDPSDDSVAAKLLGSAAYSEHLIESVRDALGAAREYAKELEARSRKLMRIASPSMGTVVEQLQEIHQLIESSGPAEHRMPAESDPTLILQHLLALGLNHLAHRFIRTGFNSTPWISHVDRGTWFRLAELVESAYNRRREPSLEKSASPHMWDTMRFVRESKFFSSMAAYSNATRLLEMAHHHEAQAIGGTSFGKLQFRLLSQAVRAREVHRVIEKVTSGEAPGPNNNPDEVGDWLRASVAIVEASLGFDPLHPRGLFLRQSHQPNYDRALRELKTINQYLHGLESMELNYLRENFQAMLASIAILTVLAKRSRDTTRSAQQLTKHSSALLKFFHEAFEFGARPLLDTGYRLLNFALFAENTGHPALARPLAKEAMGILPSCLTLLRKKPQLEGQFQKLAFEAATIYGRASYGLGSLDEASEAASKAWLAAIRHDQLIRIGPRLEDLITLHFRAREVIRNSGC